MHDPHCHLYGALTPDEALALGADHGVDWGWAVRRWHDAGLAGDPRDAAAWHLPWQGFVAFQARYDVYTACSRWIAGSHRQLAHEQADELRRVVDVVTSRHRLHGVDEIDYRLQLPASASHAFARASLEVILRALERWPGARLVVVLPRTQPLALWPVVEELRHPRLIGIDFAGYEGEPTDLAAIAPRVQAHGLELCLHVGEQLHQVSPATALRRISEAIALGCDRLGHALAARLDPLAWPAPPAWERRLVVNRNRAWLGLAPLPGDPDGDEPVTDACDPAVQERVLAELADSTAVVEVCPTSNACISGAPVAAHGLARLTRAGVRWQVATDDPGLLATDLPREMVLARGSP
jgi:hypothetical protein